MGRAMHILGALVLTSTFVTPVAEAEPKTPAAFAVVVSKDAQLDGLSLGDLRRLFLGGAQKDQIGRKLVPLNLRTKTPGRVQFDLLLLGKGPDSVGRFWIERKIQGKSGPPRAVSSPQLALRFVAAFPVAVAYVPADSVRGGARILPIDGKLPGDPDYPLRVEP